MIVPIDGELSKCLRCDRWIQYVDGYWVCFFPHQRLIVRCEHESDLEEIRRAQR